MNLSNTLAMFPNSHLHKLGVGIKKSAEFIYSSSPKGTSFMVLLVAVGALECQSANSRIELVTRSLDLDGMQQIFYQKMIKNPPIGRTSAEFEETVNLLKQKSIAKNEVLLLNHNIGGIFSDLLLFRGFNQTVRSFDKIDSEFIKLFQKNIEKHTILKQPFEGFEIEEEEILELKSQALLNSEKLNETKYSLIENFLT